MMLSNWKIYRTITKLTCVTYSAHFAQIMAFMPLGIVFSRMLYHKCPTQVFIFNAYYKEIFSKEANKHMCVNIKTYLE